MTARRCGLCGNDPAAGFASINDTFYCHGDENDSPTCYERATIGSDAEIARLREFGEHYSGAAQDAWDRIVVLEKALAYYADPSSWRQLETMGTHSADLDRGMKARDALGAGSATPGGTET